MKSRKGKQGFTLITAKSSILGDLKIDIKNASLLQFAEHPDALSDWVTDF